MLRKKEEKVLPAGMAIIVGIAFIFLFFTTTTLTVSQVRSKNANYKKTMQIREANRVKGLEIATEQEKQKQQKIVSEKKGILIAVSNEELIIESSAKNEDVNEREFFKYVVTDNTLVIVEKKFVDAEEIQQVVGEIDDLEVGKMVSIREGKSQEKEKNALIIRVTE